MDPLIANSEVRPVEWRRSTRKDQPSPGHRDRRRFGHPLPKGEGLDFGHLGSSHFGVRWLDSAFSACGFDAGWDYRREQKLPASVSGALRR